MMIQRKSKEEISFAAPLIQATMEWWTMNGGLASGNSDTYAKLLPELQISVPSEVHGLQFMYCGLESAAAKVFGREWASKVIGQPSVPDQRFEDKVRFAYQIALNEPYFDEVESVIVGPEYPVFVGYQRLILPIEFVPGVTTTGLLVATAFTTAPTPVS